MKKLLLSLGFCLLAIAGQAKRVGVYCFFADNGSQLYEDANIRLVVGLDDKNTLNVVVVNKTDKILFIDKAGSFLYFNGNTESYFTNAAYTTGNSSTGGAALNLGGAARAAGINGLAGGLLSGTTIGGSNTQSNTTTVFEQRVIGIAPMSSQVITTMTVTESLSKNYIEKGVYGFGDGFGGQLGRFVDPFTKQKEKFEIGNHKTYTENASPLSVKASVKYSLNEYFPEDETSVATASNFIEHIVIDNRKALKHSDASLPYCAPYLNRQCSAFGSGGVSFMAVLGLDIILLGAALGAAIAL